MPTLPRCRHQLTLLPQLLFVAVSAGCAEDQSWKEGSAAPEVSVIDLGEKTVKLSQFKGKAGGAELRTVALKTVARIYRHHFCRLSP